MKAEDIIGKTDNDMVWKNQTPLYVKDDKEIMTTGVPKINYEEPHTSADGENTWVRATKAPLRYDDGEIFGLLGVYEDITERKEAEYALFLEKERLKITLHSIGEGVIATDKDSKIVLINKNAEKLTGWAKNDAIGSYVGNVFSIISDRNKKPINNPVDNSLSMAKPIELYDDCILVSSDDNKIGIDFSVSPIISKKGEVLGAVLVFRDVTEKRKRDREIEYLSYHDSLTGLYNRRYFEEHVKKLDLEDMLPISIIMGDVNGLKITNDVFGHNEGDRLLKLVAEIINESVRSSDIISRWGGDEFVILLPKTDEKKVEEICNRIYSACEKYDSNKINVSISLGYSVKNKSNQDIFKVLKFAEDIMYKNKFFATRSFRSSVINSIKKTLYESSHETEEHAERMRELSYKIGIKLGLTSIQLQELELATLLHDIGKVAIMDNVLNKPGKLTDEEWLEMKRHPEIGYRIAQSVPELSQIAEYILSHHERWDGKGYPRGLKNEEIPLVSRIIAVSDSFDAMISERPYRKPLSITQAIEEIHINSKTQYDPRVVEVFMEIIT